MQKSKSGKLFDFLKNLQGLALAAKVIKRKSEIILRMNTWEELQMFWHMSTWGLGYKILYLKNENEN